MTEIASHASNRWVQGLLTLLLVPLCDGEICDGIFAPELEGCLQE